MPATAGAGGGGGMRRAFACANDRETRDLQHVLVFLITCGAQCARAGDIVTPLQQPLPALRLPPPPSLHLRCCCLFHFGPRTLDNAIFAVLFQL